MNANIRYQMQRVPSTSATDDMFRPYLSFYFTKDVKIMRDHVMEYVLRATSGGELIKTPGSNFPPNYRVVRKSEKKRTVASKAVKETRSTRYLGRQVMKAIRKLEEKRGGGTEKNIMSFLRDVEMVDTIKKSGEIRKYLIDAEDRGQLILESSFTHDTYRLSERELQKFKASNIEKPTYWHVSMDTISEAIGLFEEQKGASRWDFLSYHVNVKEKEKQQ